MNKWSEASGYEQKTCSWDGCQCLGATTDSRHNLGIDTFPRDWFIAGWSFVIGALAQGNSCSTDFLKQYPSCHSISFGGHSGVFMVIWRLFGSAHTHISHCITIHNFVIRHIQHDPFLFYLNFAFRSAPISCFTWVQFWPNPRTIPRCILRHQVHPPIASAHVQTLNLLLCVSPGVVFMICCIGRVLFILFIQFVVS